MKMNIQIRNKAKDVELVNIDIKNGNWKYWDDYMDNNEKETITINNTHDFHYINLPVKDAIPYYDPEALENNELKITKAFIRPYDSLLGYLNCRIQNIKETKGKKELTANIIIFDEDFDNDKDVCEDIIYHKDQMVEVKIKVVD